MSIYFFHLKTLDGTLTDAEGTNLPSLPAAWQHGRAVAHELMREREARTRSWRLDVEDEAGLCFSIPFAAVDDSISHFDPDLRSSLVKFSTSYAALCETINSVRLTVFGIRATIGQATGKPYIAAINGMTVNEERSPMHFAHRAERFAKDGGGEIANSCS